MVTRQLVAVRVRTGALPAAVDHRLQRQVRGEAGEAVVQGLALAALLALAAGLVLRHEPYKQARRGSRLL